MRHIEMFDTTDENDNLKLKALVARHHKDIEILSIHTAATSCGSYTVYHFVTVYYETRD